MSWPKRDRLLSYLLWGGCGASVLAAVAVVALPLGGVNRIYGVAIPFALAAAACAALALAAHIDRVLSLLLYGLSALALTYSLMSLASLPLRLTVLGTCPPAPVVCPPGFEPDMTGGETLGVEIGIALGIVALLLTVAAMEVRYQPRLRLFGRARTAPGYEPPVAPPEMKASAIVKKPATETANRGSGADLDD